ncbi:c-type cytochrome biogenesis protein CcmI [Zavarzinia sp. CC-PAN008]|uniref:c-type cytochrome biogenesis protein CcmI n=1 Tax=Zavarzinia sp. CC-PAN008 TaxID=3243332 RepID=UPI003F747700
MLWLAFAFLTLVVLGFVGWPLVRPRTAAPAAAAFDLEVYRDQLKELATDRERGLLSAEEAEAARIEVERRMLKADAERGHVEIRRTGQRRVAAAVLALGVPAVAVALYVDLGSPWLSGGQPRPQAAQAAPAAAADPAQAAAQAGDPNAADVDPEMQALIPMVERLAARLKAEPNDPDGWLMLARSYWELKQYDDAATAYGTAADLMPANADIKMAQGEAIVFAAGGLVTPAAKAAFEASAAVDPKHPGSRYYLGLERLQSGDPAAALANWEALERESPEGAPWLEQLRQRIAQAKDFAGRMPEGSLPTQHPPVPPPPAPTAQAPAAPVPPAPVAAAQPAPAPPASAPAPAPGPTAADVAAAADLSAEDRAAFIQSMVDRLATRLEQEPNDLEGWLRLGRAYGVLGQNDKSIAAYEKAVALAPADGRATTGLAQARARAGQ